MGTTASQAHRTANDKVSPSLLRVVNASVRSNMRKHCCRTMQMYAPVSIHPRFFISCVAHRFAENKALMASKDSKRIVRTYNRVAKALIEFETLWVQAWIRSIESAKAGLQSTLIVRHPTTGTAVLSVWPSWLLLRHEAAGLPQSAKFSVRVCCVPTPKAAMQSCPYGTCSLSCFNCCCRADAGQL